MNVYGYKVQNAIQKTSNDNMEKLRIMDYFL